jgi:ATP-dependent Clp protease ATP-binding subunit ClpB
MDFAKYTERARGFLQAAQNLAVREGHQQFTPEHILKVLLDDEEGLAAGLIERAGGRAREALAATERALAALPKVSGSGAGGLTRPADAGLRDRGAIRQESRRSFVTVERLLLALAIEKTSKTAKVLADAGVTPQTLNAAIEEIRKGRTADSASAENQYDALKKYTRDLTADAREGKLDPVIGRDDEPSHHPGAVAPTKNNRPDR